jgi:hypothetical protein
MGKRDITLAASLAPFAAMGMGVADEAAAQPDTGYEPVGISAGGFKLIPELQLAVEYSDNALAVDKADPNAKEQSDYLYQLLPSVRLESDWSTHELNLYAESTIRSYSKLSDQNSSDVKVGFDGRLDVDRNFNFIASGSYGDLTEPLSESPADTQLAKPIEYTRAEATLGFVKAFNALRVSGKVGVDSLNYDNGVRLDNSQPFLQDFRDHTTDIYGLRADYTVSPATSLFLAATGNKRDYDSDAARNSDGYDVLAGVKFEATDLIQGEIGVGYLSQTYKTSNADVNGLAARVALNWQPDELVTVRLAGERAVRDAGVASGVSYVANDVSLGVDYAIRRNITIGAEARYSRDDYNDIDRDDKRTSYDAHIDYALNRTAAVFISAGHDQQDSSGLNAGRNFEVNRAEIGIKLRR